MDLETVSLEALPQYAQKLDNKNLLTQTEFLVSKERELTAKTLVLFREIEIRMIHLEKGYSSLFEMLVHYFHLSEGSASRRVASIRLMTQIPEIEDKIKEGSLTLTNVASAQRFFKAEAKNNRPFGLEEKKEVLEALVGKSTREAERELCQRSSLPPDLQIPDQIKPKGSDHVEIRFLARQELCDLLEEARGLLAHRLPDASMADLIQLLAEMGIERLKKERFGVGRSLRSKDQIQCESPMVDQVENAEEIQPRVENFEEAQSQMKDSNEVRFQVVSTEKEDDAVGADVLNTSAKSRNRHIPMHIRRRVFLRAQGRCEYTDKNTRKRCNSTQFLELDHHKKPFARGGEHTEDSLILACRSHNRLRAVKDFGDHMQKYRKSP